MRGMLTTGMVGDALALGANVASRARTTGAALALARMTPALLRSTARRLVRAAR